MDLAKSVLQRETCKQDFAANSKAVWDARFNLVDLKRKFPTLGSKEDDELFHDKERVPKRPKTEAYVFFAFVCEAYFLISV